MHFVRSRQLELRQIWHGRCSLPDARQAICNSYVQHWQRRSLYT